MHIYMHMHTPHMHTPMRKRKIGRKREEERERERLYKEGLCCALAIRIKQKDYQLSMKDFQP